MPAASTPRNLEGATDAGSYVQAWVWVSDNAVEENERRRRERNISDR